MKQSHWEGVIAFVVCAVIFGAGFVMGRNFSYTKEEKEQIHPHKKDGELPKKGDLKKGDL